MAHITPVDRAAEPGLAGVFAAVEGSMGFLPNSMLTMAHMPQLAMATDLEAAPLAFAGKALAALDWSTGKHG